MHPVKHLYLLDVARAIAASAVLIWHWQHFFMVGSSLPLNFTRSDQPLYSILGPLYNHGHLAVPFFFQLSGFVFFWLYREQIETGTCSVYKFAVQRFARLYPLHITTLIAVLALQTIYQETTGGYFVYQWNDFYHFGLQLALVSDWGLERGYSFNGPIWSVSIEIGLYCCFVIYCLTRVPTAIKLTAVLVGANLLALFGFESRWPSGLTAFFLGGLTYILSTQYLRYRTLAWDYFLLSVSTLAWLSLCCSNTVKFWLLTRGDNSIYFIFPVTIATLVAIETRYPNIAKRFAWTGNITYSSYLLHFPLQVAFMISAILLGYDATVFKSPFMLTAFLTLLFAASILTYYQFERPMQNLIRGRMLPSPISSLEKTCPVREARVSTEDAGLPTK